jgi:hypothetical protein
MNDKKLTPRVGDRVLVIRGFDSQVTHSKCGWVRSFDKYGGPLVDVDGVAERMMVPLPHLEGVDRQPVEWPEGWSRFSSSMVAHRNQRTFSRAELEDITQAGPDMLDRWDELMGGDA